MSNSASSQTIVCVAGMHRSGTSLLMQLLSECGIETGEHKRISQAGGRDNPTGYWEHPAFQRINKRILRVLGGSWKCPPTVDAGRAENHPGLKSLYKEATDLVAQFQSFSWWGWKDPRNSLTLPFWLKLFPELRVVVAYRNPLQVALSLQARMNRNPASAASFHHSLYLWAAYYDRIFQTLESQPEHPVVNFEALLYDPEKELTRILAALALPVDRDRIATAAKAINPALFRNSVSEDLLDELGVSPALAETYRRLGRLAGPQYRSLRQDEGYRQTRRESDTAFLNSRQFDRLRLPPKQSDVRETHNRARLEDLEIAVIHYLHVRPTVAMLTAFFRHYPEARITLVDNSGGRCRADRMVLPHLGRFVERIQVLRNPATDYGPEGRLSHGAGIDLARKQCRRPYLLIMESDTIVLQRGCLEYALALIETGYDWGGVAQKPVGDGFANFSPHFAIFRVDLLNKYDLSFRRRPRPAEQQDFEDPLIQHHLATAERVRSGLPVEYPEGKPPDTYRLAPDRIVLQELKHLDYFDTGEWVHHVLTRKGHRGHLFRPLSSVCHIWGSRSESLFLQHFREKLPEIDINSLLPSALSTNLEPLPLKCLKLVQEHAPARHWTWTAGPPGELAAVDSALEVSVNLAEEEKIYLAMGRGSFQKPPPESVGARLAAGTAHCLACAWTASSGVKAQLWIIEYTDNIRFQHHRIPLENGHNELHFVTGPRTDRFRVLFRLTGRGRGIIRELELLSPCCD